jgi:hypothetical protein
MGTGSFPGVNSGRGVTLTPHLLLVPWSWKSRAIPLPILWAVRSVQSLSACTKGDLYLYLDRRSRNFAKAPENDLSLLQIIKHKYIIYTSACLREQCGCRNPEGHEHTPGRRQTPPLRHGGWHTAASNTHIYRFCTVTKAIVKNMVFRDETVQSTSFPVFHTKQDQRSEGSGLYSFFNPGASCG